MQAGNKSQIEQVAIDTLIPYARNSRTHSDEQVAQVAASIREFGFTNPVLIDSDGGIIAGHGRVLAARKLQLKEVPCIRLSHLTETQKKAYIIADNSLALNSGWNDELLGLELNSLHDEGFDMGLVGFNAAELSKLMGFDMPLDESEFGGDPSDKFQLLIEFDSEQELQEEFNRCQERGLTCKLIQ